MNTTMMVIAGTAVAVGCLLIGAMLYVLYEKITRFIVSAVEMHLRNISNGIDTHSRHIKETVRREATTVLDSLNKNFNHFDSSISEVKEKVLFGARLKAWRHKNQLTIKDVFNRTGISTGQISNIERGMQPSVEELGILGAMISLDHKPDGALDFEKVRINLEV